jgi:hypothetical protein
LTPERVALGQIKIEAAGQHALHGSVAIGGQVVSAETSQGEARGFATFQGDVPEVDFNDVKEGAATTLKVLTYPEKTFEGKVAWRSDVLDPALHAAKVRCAIIDPEGALRPGMTGTLTLWTKEGRALAVRSSALLKLGFENELFVQIGSAADGRLRFERRAVTVGEQGEEYVPILSGLREGENVVSGGGIFLAAEASR